MKEPQTSWLLRAVLLLYPEKIRREHGQEMLDFVRDERDALGAASNLQIGSFYLRSLFDLARGALRARLRGPLPPLTTYQEARWINPGNYNLASRLNNGLRELGFAARSLARSPLVSVTIVLTLALAIGMNTAIFSVVHGVLLKPFEYQAPEELVYVGARWEKDEVDRALHTGRDFDLFKESIHSFEDVAAMTAIRQNLTGGELPRQVEVGWASRNFFQLLGVQAKLGAGFTADAPAGTLVLSDHLFRELFSGDPSVLGTSLELDGRSYTVAGVLPSGFELHFPSLPERVDVWKVPDDWWQNGDFWQASGSSFALLRVIGRLTEDATLDEARQELMTLARIMRENDPEQERIGLQLDAEPLHTSVVGGVRPVLVLLFGAVLLVLVIACANVTNLLLVRAHQRSQELALRRALGTTQAGIARLLLLDSVVLAVVGGAAGIGLGYAGTRLLKSLPPEGLPRLDQVTLDPVVLSFALVLALSATLAAGLVPALKAARAHGFSLGSARTTTGRSSHRLSDLIVIFQIGASVVLLIGAVLLTTSLARLSKVDPGFEPDQVLTFSVSLPGTSYERPEGTNRFLRTLEERLVQMPEVEAAAVVWPLPLGNSRWSGLYAAGQVADGSRAYAQYSVVTPNLFDTLRIPLVMGNGFSSSDPRHVAVVSRNLAEKAFPDRNAIGSSITANPWGGDPEVFEVIGIVDNIRYADLREPTPETIYFDSRGWSWTDWEFQVAVRASGHPESLVPQIRQTLAGLDPSIPLSQVHMMEDYVDDQLAANRFAVSLIGLFAAVAASLALMGLYSLISFTTSQRTREIGIRIALGAARGSILTWVMRRGIAVTGAGIVLGLLAAWFLTRLAESLLFEVTSTDGVTFLVVAASLAAVAFLASYLPARRATRVDPIRVLRAE